MVRVCQEWYPKGSYKGQKDDGFYMDDILKQQLDILIKNVVNDWDFTLIVSGGGEVRVGKSVLAMQIAAYWTHQLERVHKIKVPFDVQNNFIFQWEKLIEKGNILGEKHKHSPLIYDEAGETMEGTKTMTGELKAVRDFLRECGQYNFLNVLVLPEFFDLPRGIALTRSKCLLDVYYQADDVGLFQRGFFAFYSLPQKKKLFLHGRKELNYNAAKPDFRGRFYNMYPIDEEKYRILKQEALREREFGKRDKVKLNRNLAWHTIKEITGWENIKIREHMSKRYKQIIAKTTFDEAIRDISLRYPNK